MPEQALPFPLPVIPPRFTPLTAAAQNRKLASQLYARFFSWPIERSRKIIETTPPEVWEREGQRRALQVFHAAAERVPAYKDFLKKHKIEQEKVRTIADFKKVVPTVDKENYLRRYSLADLCWDGILASTQITSVSSGSTGDPFFWPRGTELEFETTYLFEYLLDSLEALEKPTLVVNAFAMGMYIGGPFTVNAVLRIAQKGSPITLVTPGYALDEILRVTPLLGGHYSQVVLASYPPFAKAIIDEGISRGVNWAQLHVRFMLAGEGFNETWRDYVADLAGHRDPLRDFVNLYGTADAAVLGFETPMSIWARRHIAGSPRRQREIFGEDRLPSFLQYVPTIRYFEEDEKRLLFTVGGTGIPLVRYDIHDQGSVMSFSDFVASAGLSEDDLPERRLVPRVKLPFVYLFGRRDFTSILYGANVYPENIKTALEDQRLRKFFTGRFTMWTDADRHQDQYLVVNLECAAGVRGSARLRRETKKVIIETLQRVNSEYRVAARAIGRKARPRVRLFPKGDPRYFGVGIKHRWAKRHSQT